MTDTNISNLLTYGCAALCGIGLSTNYKTIVNCYK